MTTHDDNMKQQISAYCDDALNEQERKIIEDHLCECQECQTYYKELQSLSRVLKQWPDQTISPDLTTNLHKKMSSSWKDRNSSKKSLLTVGGGGLLGIILILFVVTIQSNLQKGVQGRLKSAAIDDISIPESSYQEEDVFEVAQSKGEGNRQNQLTSVGKEEQQADDFPSSVVARNSDGFGKIEDHNSIGALLSSQVTGDDRGVYDKSAEFSVQGGKQDIEQLVKNKIQEAEVFPQKKAVITSNDSLFEAKEKQESFAAGRELSSPRVSTASDKSSGYLDTMDRKVSFKRRENEKTQVTLSQKSSDQVQTPSMPYYDEYQDYDPRQGGDISFQEGFYPPIPKEQPIDYEYVQNHAERSTEEYDSLTDNPFVSVQQEALSTFSIDVDTAAYSNIRRFVDNNQLPPRDAVRIEELVNYFNYDYPEPQRGQPFSVAADGAVCPWNQNNYLVRIGLQGKVPKKRSIPPSNLVFLIDVSGSMNQSNKLPLLKQSFKRMVQTLGENERIAIVTYAGNAQVVLNSTSASDKYTIMSAIDRLRAGGSTAGSAGLQMAYQMAHNNFIRKGNNRIIVASDGDFNVGIKNDDELVRYIEGERNQGIFLTILGFGTGNIKDAKLEKIANKGNGSYHYIDSLQEGQKILVDELGSTLFTIAKDVKVQVEFNPQHVKSYRLIGYENRSLSKYDFNNDKVDAGELGAGHTVTALYEVVPSYNRHETRGGVDSLKYQKKPLFSNPEVLTVKLRYKEPNGKKSQLIKRTLHDKNIHQKLEGDFKFAASVAEFGMLLRRSPYRSSASYDNVIQKARRSIGEDKGGQRQEFLNMVERVRHIDIQPQPIPYPLEPVPYQYHNEDSRSKMLFKNQ